MKNSKLKLGILLIIVLLFAGGLATIMIFNQPHRDVQAIAVDYELDAKDLVTEYLTDSKSANEKYLHTKGESKIIIVKGIVATITQDLKKQKVVLLREPNKKVGVSCTFMLETNSSAEQLKIGEQVQIKGVIRSGAGYDHDLEMYEDVIIEKCDLFKEVESKK